MALDSTYSARLSDVVSFLNDGEVDVRRIVDLALPLSYVRYWPVEIRRFPTEGSIPCSLRPTRRLWSDETDIASRQVQMPRIRSRR